MIRAALLSIGITALAVVVGATVAAQGYREHLVSQLEYECGIKTTWVPNFYLDWVEADLVPQWLRGEALTQILERRALE